uniref:Solute carrier family 19 member 1 n=1 Tax=Propithecus coquereli TaxID=379532 RepID=A0A2K6GW67_PROCO
VCPGPAQPASGARGLAPARPQVTNEIMPVLSYSYMLVLVPVFLLTDYLRYKPVLLLQGLSFVCVWLLLLQGRSVLHMQLMELFYSVTMAARIAYSSYIFSLVRPARYQRMAGYSRAAVLLGVFTSSVLGQLLVTAGGVSFTTLNYVSLGFLIFSLLLALFLKRPKRSLFFNRGAPLRGASPSELGPMRPGPAPRGKLRAACRDFVLVRMLRELGASLRLPQLRVWSLWWVFNSAGYYLVAPHPASRRGSQSEHGHDFCTKALRVIACVSGADRVRVSLVFRPEPLPRYLSIVAAPALPPQSDPGLHLPFSFQIASSLSKELCALVFGVNTFFATILKTVITLIVSDKRGLGLVVHSQFQVYFMYFLVLSVLYLLGAVLDGLRHFRQRHQPLPLAQELRSPLEEKAEQGLSLQDGGLRGPQPSAPPPHPAWASGPASQEQSQPAPAQPTLLEPSCPHSCPDQAWGPELARVVLSMDQ